MLFLIFSILLVVTIHCVKIGYYTIYIKNKTKKTKNKNGWLFMHRRLLFINLKSSKAVIVSEFL